MCHKCTVDVMMTEEQAENLLYGMSLRAMDWLAFSAKVLKHIEEYTVPQYKDKGQDICTNYTVEECLNQTKKYIERYGKNAREGQQELDFLKAAHFIQMGYEKYMTVTNPDQV